MSYEESAGRASAAQGRSRRERVRRVQGRTQGYDALYRQGRSLFHHQQWCRSEESFYTFKRDGRSVINNGVVLKKKALPLLQRGFVTGFTKLQHGNACKLSMDDTDQSNHEIDVLSGHENDVNYVQFRLNHDNIVTALVMGVLLYGFLNHADHISSDDGTCRI